jgi:multiple sugar transport system substrate-binding protein
MMPRLSVLRHLAALVCGVCLATAATAGQLTLRYNDPETTQMRAALDVFEKENPGTKVVLERGAWGDALPQFLREAAVGSGPDVMHSAFVWVKDLASAGAVLPLDPLVAPQKPADAFAQAVALDLATGRDGKIYGLPWTVDTWSMVYNTELMQRAGVATIPTTWDEFRDAARKVHAATGKIGFAFPFGGGGSNSIWFAANFWWWSHGQGLVIKQPDGKFALGVDAPGVIAAMAYFKSFLDDGTTPKGMVAVSNWGDPAIMEPMINGDAWATMLPPANFKQIVSSWQTRHPGATQPFTSALVPADKAGSVTVVGGRTLVINANTQDPQAAWKLVQFLSRQSFFTTYLTTQLPANKALLSGMDFGPGMGGYAQQLQRARTWGPYSEGPVAIGTMWNEVGRDFGAMFVGEMTAEQAAQRLLQAIGSGLK